MPNVRVVGETLSTGATPVPDALTEALPPLLAILTVALLEPVVTGLKATVKV